MLPGSILRKLDIAHQKSNKLLNLGVYYKNTLVALCHALEDFILEADSSVLMIAAFQRGKWYLEEAERYGKLAEKATQIAIMAAPDAGFTSHPTSQLEKVNLVRLQPEDPIAQEWHLIIVSPSYTAMVLCQELSAADYGAGNQPQADLERKFYGFWTFEPEIVRETVQLAISHIETYDPPLAQNLQTTLTEITAKFGHQQRDDLDAVVSKVVNYLQNCQSELHHPNQANNFGSSQDLDDNIVANEMQAFLRMAEIIDRTDIRNPMAAAEVTALAAAMGQLLDLPAWQIKRLNLSGLLHRVGSLPATTQPTKNLAQKQALQGSSEKPKASVLRIMPQLQAIANIVTHQTESWDGSGYPSSLAYDDIPLESRIIRLVADFQRQIVLYKQQSVTENVLTQALADCQVAAGIIYDPKLVDALTLLVMGMQQGMNLEVYQPKITSGMWLMDSELADQGQSIPS